MLIRMKMENPQLVNKEQIKSILKQQERVKPKIVQSKWREQ
jgi:hypothetical protein